MKAQTEFLIFQNIRPGWTTPQERALKLSELNRKGLPDVTGWKMITLTLRQQSFCDEADGYEAGKRKLRTVLFKLRKQYGEFKWCWKLEFQQNGWVHWHVLVEIKRKFTIDQMRQIEYWWGLGSTNVRATDEGGLRYLFKYLSKAPYQGADEIGGLPAWFAEYLMIPGDGKKPTSYARARFWQTSRGFYTGQITPDDDGDDGLPKDPPKKSYRVMTFSEAWQMKQRSWRIMIAYQARVLKSRTIRGDVRGIKAELCQMLLTGEAIWDEFRRFVIDPRLLPCLQPYFDIVYRHRPLLIVSGS